MVSFSAAEIYYPVSDALALGLLAGMLAVFGLRSWRAWWPVSCSFAVFAMADSIYSTASRRGATRRSKSASTAGSWSWAFMLVLAVYA